MVVEVVVVMNVYVSFFKKKDHKVVYREMTPCPKRT